MKKAKTIPVLTTRCEAQKKVRTKPAPFRTIMLLKKSSTLQQNAIASPAQKPETKGISASLANKDKEGRKGAEKTAGKAIDIDGPAHFSSSSPPVPSPSLGFNFSDRSKPPQLSWLMDSRGQIKPEFRNLKIIFAVPASATGLLRPEQGLLRNSRAPPPPSMNPPLIMDAAYLPPIAAEAGINGTEARSGSSSKVIKRGKSRERESKCKKPRHCSPIPQVINLVRVGSSIRAEVSSNSKSTPRSLPIPAAPKPLLEPILRSPGQNKESHVGKEQVKGSERNAEFQFKVPQGPAPLPKKMWKTKWDSTPKTEVVPSNHQSPSTSSPATSKPPQNAVEAPSRIQVADKVHLHEPTLVTPITNGNVDDDDKAASDANVENHAVDAEGDDGANHPPKLLAPPSHRMDRVMGGKLFQMFEEYVSGVMRGVMKNYPAEGSSNGKNKEKRRPHHIIQDAKNYFETVFRPRIRQLGNEEILDQVPRLFVRTALEIATSRQSFCKNCGIIDEYSWCPCRVAGAGDYLISSIPKMFRDKADFIEFATQEARRIYKPEYDQSQSHEDCGLIPQTETESLENVITSPEIQIVEIEQPLIRQTRKLAVVTRGKHFLRPRPLPKRKCKKHLWE